MTALPRDPDDLGASWTSSFALPIDIEPLVRGISVFDLEDHVVLVPDAPAAAEPAPRDPPPVLWDPRPARPSRFAGPATGDDFLPDRGRRR